MLTADTDAPGSPPPFDPEVVIREARRHRRRRWLLIGGAVIVVMGSVAGVTAVFGGQHSRTTRPGPTTTLTAPATTGLQPCDPSHLTVTVTNTGSATGSTVGVGTFENRGSRTCTLDGYPSLQMLSSSGASIPTTTKIKTTVPGGGAPETIHLGPGQQASFTFSTSDGNQFTPATRPDCPEAASFLVIPPGSTQGVVTPILARGGPAGLTALPYTAGQPCGRVAVSAIIPGPALRARCPACIPPPPGEVPSTHGDGARAADPPAPASSSRPAGSSGSRATARKRAGVRTG